MTVLAGSGLWHDMIDPRDEMREGTGGQESGASKGSPPAKREAKKKEKEKVER